ncbi:hypothetical protein ACH5RX_002486 [Enterococcus faecalis]|nr:hypothetical protein [Enterococcus faecalis]ELT8948017.1 hypothetical protein [Enterococcus faecalis]
MSHTELIKKNLNVTFEENCCEKKNQMDKFVKFIRENQPTRQIPVNIVPVIRWGIIVE